MFVVYQQSAQSWQEPDLEAMLQRAKLEFSVKDLAAAHSRLKTEHKHDPSAAEAYGGMSRKERGVEALSLLFTKDKFSSTRSLTGRISADHEVTKKERWISEKEMKTKFYDDEFDAHVASGRIQWREDEFTPGMYRYYDQGDVAHARKVNKGKVFEETEDQGEVDPEDSSFQKFWSELTLGSGSFKSLGNDQDLWSLSLSDKGKGRGLTPNKGKGKGKNPPTPQPPLALEDLPETEQQELCLNNARKMMGFVQKQQRDLEECETHLKRSKYNNKTHQQELKQVSDELESVFKVIKTHLLSAKTFSVEVRKAALVRAGQACKDSTALVKDKRNLCKDLNQEAKGKRKIEGADDDGTGWMTCLLHIKPVFCLLQIVLALATSQTLLLTNHMIMDCQRHVLSSSL